MVATVRNAYRLIDHSQRWRWALVILIAVAASAVEALAAVMVYILLTVANGDLDVPVLGDLRQRFPDAAESTIVAWLAVVMVVFFLVRALVLVLQAFLQNRTASEAGAAVSRRLVMGYLRMPYSFHLLRNSAESIRTAYQAVLDVVGFVFVPIVTLLSESLVVIAMLLVLLITAPVATLLVIGFLTPAVFVLMRLVQPRIAATGVLAQESHELNLRNLQQSLSGVREIKVLGRESFFERKYAGSRLALARAIYRRSALAEVPRISIETLLMLLIVGFVGITAISGGSLQKSVTVLGLFGYAALRVMPGLNRSIAQLNNLKYGRAAMDQVIADVAMIEAQAAPLAGSGRALPFEQVLRVEGVSFRYPAADRDALSCVSLEVARGESIGIVGSTGSGKSTLVDLILGLHVPTAGRVTCDGVDVHASVAAWQRNAGVVPQTVFLLDDTLRRNIALGIDDEEIDEDALAEAIALAQLEPFVASLPDGLDTIVGEFGVRISGGQRQRVAIARALYHRPAVLFFDEGTAALDNATEAELIRALDHLRGERTIFTIAHRLSTVSRCDRIVVIRDGRVADVGRYDDLMSRHAELQQASA
jgi:ABC-type multidrug transport system fused ATPase/permease subunit